MKEAMNRLIAQRRFPFRIGLDFAVILWLTAGTAPANAASIEDGLLVHLRMDGDARDETGINPNGVLNGPVASAADRFGRAGRALSFGEGTWVTMPVTNLPGGTAPRTVAIWVKPAILPQHTAGGILTYGIGDCSGKMTGLGFNQDRAFFWGGCRDFDSGVPLVAGQWNFIAASYDGVRLTMNVNGTNRHRSLGLATVATEVIWLGRETRTADPASGGQFLGALDELRIFSRALSTEELHELFTQPSDGPVPPDISLQPLPRAAVTGQDVTFEVAAIGDQPLSFQWFKDGEPLAGATNAALQLAAVTAADIGGYKVVVTNPYGSATSEPAVLRLADIRTGLLVHLRLDGDAVDTTGRNSPGLIQGATPTEDRFGMPGGAMLFDGVDDVITVVAAGLPNTNAPRTMAVWFRSESVRESPGGLVHWGGFSDGRDHCTGHVAGLGHHEGYGYVWGGCQDYSTGQLPVGQWHFLAASYRRDGTLYVNINGQLATNQLGLLNTVLSSNFWVGAVTVNQGANFVRRFHGAVDDVRIYNRALTPEDLEMIYLAGRDTPAVVISGEARTADLDTDFALTAVTHGAAPTSAQWFKDGEPLPGATNATLSLVEVEPADAGVYKLAVSNLFGVAYGPAIPLLVNPALDPAAVLDLADLAFALRDKLSWLADSNVVRVGAASLRSGVVGHGEASSLVTYVRGPGELRFWWRVSSEPGFDRFECWLSGTRVGVISGEQAWQEVTLPLPAGPQEVRWTYRRDPSGDGGQNRAWLDGVNLTRGPGVPEPFALTRPRFRRRDGLFSTVLHGPPGVYVVEETSDAGEWAPRLTVTNQTGEVEIRTARPEDREPRLQRVRQP